MSKPRDAMLLASTVILPYAYPEYIPELEGAQAPAKMTMNSENADVFCYGVVGGAWGGDANARFWTD